MTIDEIKELIQIVKDTGIAELEVRRGENSVRVRGAVLHSSGCCRSRGVGDTASCRRQCRARLPQNRKTSAISS